MILRRANGPIVAAFFAAGCAGAEPVATSPKDATSLAYAPFFPVLSAFALRQPAIEPGERWPTIEPIGYAVKHAVQIDIYKGIMGAEVVVLHGLAPDLDPQKPVEPGASGAAWRFDGSQGGARVYHPMQAHTRSVKYVLIVVAASARGQTWVVDSCGQCDAISSDQIEKIARAGEPTPLPMREGAYATEFFPTFDRVLPSWAHGHDSSVVAELSLFAGSVNLPSPAVLQLHSMSAPVARAQAADLDSHREGSASIEDPLLRELVKNTTNVQVAGSTVTLVTSANPKWMSEAWSPEE